jgi:hypothetical protein
MADSILSTAVAPLRADLLWKQYALHVDLYKFYMDLTLKANVFFYGITGGILAYFFNNAAQPMMRYALLLPIAMSFTLAGVFLYGAATLGVVRDELFALRDQIGFDTAPEFKVLQLALVLFGVLLLLVAIVIGVVMAFPGVIEG